MKTLLAGPKEMMKISGSAMKLFFFLVGESDRDCHFRASMTELMRATGMSEKTLRAARAELSSLKLLSFKSPLGGRGHRTSYKLLSQRQKSK